MCTLCPFQTGKNLFIRRVTTQCFILNQLANPLRLRIKQKLLLFTVFKVSSTVFTQLAKRLDGVPNWDNGCGNVQNPMTTNLTYLTDVPPKRAEEILLDPAWTKAIFVRDPKERVLSAYLNKAVAETSYIKKQCCSKGSDDVKALLECHNAQSLVSVQLLFAMYSPDLVHSSHSLACLLHISYIAYHFLSGFLDRGRPAMQRWPLGSSIRFDAARTVEAGQLRRTFRSTRG